MITILLALIYIGFISLGLPDSLFGAAWPSIRDGLGLDVGLGGIYSLCSSGATIISSLFSARLINKFGTGKLVVVSVAVTAVAVLLMPLVSLTAVPFVLLCSVGFLLGLGGGAIDAALNNFVALHFSAMHMNFLHCFWAVGCTVSPLAFSFLWSRGGTWQQCYLYIGIAQCVITVMMIFALPLWKRVPLKLSQIKNTAATQKDGEIESKPENIKFLDLIKIRYMKTAMAAFFCYCAYELAFGLWITSYMQTVRGFSIEAAARFSGAFFIGIAAGRFISGLFAAKLGSKKLMRIGNIVVLCGVIVLLLRQNEIISFIAAIAVGTGAGPFYPNLMFRAPQIFGKKRSQAAIGLLMASAYTGLTTLPPIIGIIPLKFFPVAIGVLAVFAFIMAEVLPNQKSDVRG
ncbi:MAG: MFS transporter [Ruminococcus sp.]|jgi:fucose permease|nr:MFS transporter [Ruminococcus sp.]